MLKATISKQKQDKERLLAKVYVTRAKEQDAQEFISSDLGFKTGQHLKTISTI
ncbi:MAG: hypothetical protein HYV78_02530 [Candidatus Wildermuthbacteria bacterium]|nr:hypothetical protein [Candidatus Wildermuthbacteria bacterium]